MENKSKNITECIQQSFLNSLFIEVRESAILKKSVLAKLITQINDIICLREVDNILFFENRFLIGIKEVSPTLQHSYLHKFFIKEEDLIIEISFIEWATKIANHYLKNDPIKANIFSNRLRQSHDNIISDHNRFHPFNNPLFNFNKSESLLVFGHYAHPYPKLRENEKLENYVVEEQTKIKWIHVHRKLINIEAAQSFGLNRAYEELLFLAKHEGFKTLEHYLPFPIHHYQWEIMKDNQLREYILNKDIIETECFTMMTPTTSLRCLHNNSLDWMMKFSLSVRLTNSIRHLKIHGARRGMLLHEIMADSNKNSDTSAIEILQEPFFLAIKNSNDEIIEESIVIFRENPFKDKNQNDLYQEVSLAVITQEIPNTGKTIIRKILDDINTNCTSWFETSFLEKVLGPIIELQSKRGILIGAHQQNLILVFDNDLNISKTYYRDTQGTGFLSDRQNRDLGSSKEQTTNFISLELSNMLVGYYLIINSTLSMIKALCQTTEEENKLIELTKNYLIALEHKLNTFDKRFIQYVLNSPTLKTKNNFRCCLENFNENELKDPFILYQNVKNPFFIKLQETQQNYTLTNNILHPIRPTYKEGEILYTNYSSRIKKNIRIRVIDRERDLDTFHQWHNQKRVSFFWELNLSKVELLDYISKGLSDPHQMPTIIEFEIENNTYIPIGYFEIYWTKEDRLGPYYDASDYDRGIHLLIGNSAYLGFDNTDTILKHICNYIFKSNPKTQSIMGEPRHDNEKILRYLETFKAWERIKEFEFPHKKAILLRCDRTKFFEGNYL